MITKKDILKLKSTAYYSGFGGLEVKAIEYDLDEYLLCVTGTWTSQMTAHRLKIYYPPKGSPYVKLYGYRILLDECIRM